MNRFKNLQCAVLVQAAPQEQKGPVGEHYARQLRNPFVLRVVFQARKNARCPVLRIAVNLDQCMFVAVHRSNDVVRFSTRDDSVELGAGTKKGRLQHGIEIRRYYWPGGPLWEPPHSKLQRLLRG